MMQSQKKNGRVNVDYRLDKTIYLDSVRIRKRSLQRYPQVKIRITFCVETRTLRNKNCIEHKGTTKLREYNPFLYLRYPLI